MDRLNSGLSQSASVHNSENSPASDTVINANPDQRLNDIGNASAEPTERITSILSDSTQPTVSSNAQLILGALPDECLADVARFYPAAVPWLRESIDANEQALGLQDSTVDQVAEDVALESPFEVLARNFDEAIEEMESVSVMVDRAFMRGGDKLPLSFKQLAIELKARIGLMCADKEPVLNSLLAMRDNVLGPNASRSIDHKVRLLAKIAKVQNVLVVGSEMTTTQKNSATTDGALKSLGQAKTALLASAGNIYFSQTQTVIESLDIYVQACTEVEGIMQARLNLTDVVNAFYESDTLSPELMMELAVLEAKYYEHASGVRAVERAVDKAGLAQMSGPDTDLSQVKAITFLAKSAIAQRDLVSAKLCLADAKSRVDEMGMDGYMAPFAHFEIAQIATGFDKAVSIEFLGAALDSMQEQHYGNDRFVDSLLQMCGRLQHSDGFTQAIANIDSRSQLQRVKALSLAFQHLPVDHHEPFLTELNQFFPPGADDNLQDSDWLQNQNYSDNIHSALVEGYAHAGEYQIAEAAIAAIGDADSGLEKQVASLCLLAEKNPSKRDEYIVQAQEKIGQIKHPPQRRKSRVPLAEALLKSGQIVAARQFILQIRGSELASEKLRLHLDYFDHKNSKALA